jgi:glutamate-ammonia-ligase adenylyltransferase
LPEALRAGVEHVWESYAAACTEAAVPVLRHPEMRALLSRVWAGSSFVAQSCITDPALLGDLLDSGDLLLNYGADGYRHRFARALGRCRDEQALMSTLRRLRRREMVRIAWRDLCGWSDLESTLRETSWLAEAAIDGALTPLARWMAKEHGRPRDAAGDPMGLAVLGMGKLGAWELNFSSDIDLIYAYSVDGETRGRRALDHGSYFSELGRRLVNVLGRIDEDGFVFRVDLRLRPYGDSGPLAMSLAQMEDYYQIQGREWERYAMIKARPVGGDRAAGDRLLAMLRPFVYRKYLDFGVFESLREMKATIDREAARRDMKDDIKRGPGGIREIEFIGQTYQLIRGGREPTLRDQRILVILGRLEAMGHLSTQAGHELAASYRYLRRLENRLQIFADAQTHRLPTEALERQRLAWTMGHRDVTAFERELAEHRSRVRDHFDRIFGEPARKRSSGADAGPDYTALWSAAATLPGRLAEVSEEAADLVADLAGGHPLPAFGEEGWRRLAALRDSYLYRSLSAIGRSRMDRLMPLLLEAVAAAPRPDTTLPRVIEFIEHVARRSAYLALLADNPVVLAQMVRLCAASPWIARMLGDQPLLLDELIDPSSLERPLARPALEEELAARLAAVGPEDLEQQMEALRQFKQANVLRVAAADIGGAMPLMVVSDHLTDIAEVCLDAVLRLAVAHTVARNRDAQQAIAHGFAIVAYGKLGGIELGYGSDLDIVFLHGGSAEHAFGPVYARLGQRIIHMLSAHTPAGVLYSVDLRLRPSGSSGLLVSSIDAFEEYQRNQAWTWEHQALVRARIVALTGDEAVVRRFAELRHAVLARPREAATLATEIRDMRERMRQELSRGDEHHFDLKQDRGGIADIEFIVQYAVLRWAADHPGLLRWTDNIRLLETLKDAGLLEARDAAAMTDAYRSLRARVHRLALQETSPALAAADEFPAERTAVTAVWRALIDPAAGGTGRR